MTITAAAFARLAGVSKVAVSKAPDLKVHKEPDGSIDPGHPTNALYLAQHQRGANPAPAVKPVKSKTPKTDEVEKRLKAEDASVGRVKTLGVNMADLSPAEKRQFDAARKKAEADLAEAENLPVEKYKADIALKRAMTALHEFKLATNKKNVISRDEFRRIAEEWNAKLGQSVMRVPRRVISRLWAMAKAGDEARDGEAYLEKALSAAVTRALEGVAGGK